MNLVTVREHARITIGAAAAAESLDRATIPKSAFDWLCEESARLRPTGAPLVQMEDRRWLRLDNHVGVLETPCGTRIEILPKHVDGGGGIESARRALVAMLRGALHLQRHDTGPTALHTFNQPVSEWIIGEFLAALAVLVQRGVRFHYNPVEEELRFLRGRLRIGAQLRQPPGRRHLFQVEHEVFDANCPENRLLVAALAKVARQTKTPANWRHAHELQHLLAEIPPSRDIAGDFRRWRDDRLMARYRALRPWCELILTDRDPASVLGTWRGRSLLFPMEQVFEAWVGARLRHHLPREALLRPQAASRYLCTQEGRDIFQLKPDFLIEHEGSTWVVDAKWKRLDSSNRTENYGLAQADMYQLHAYGHRYLRGRGRLVLVFPRTASFCAPLPPFDFGDGMRLGVIPIDLDSGLLMNSRNPALPRKSTSAPETAASQVFAETA